MPVAGVTGPFTDLVGLPAGDWNVTGGASPLAVLGGGVVHLDRCNGSGYLGMQASGSVAPGSGSPGEGAGGRPTSGATCHDG